MNVKNKNGYYALKACISYIKTFKYRFLIVFGLLLSGSVLIAIVPIFIGELVQVLATSPVDITRTYTLVGVLVLLSVLNPILWHAGDWFYLKWLNDKQFGFETLIFQSVLAKPYPYFVDKFAGKISSYVSSLGREFRQFLSDICYQYIGLLVQMPVVLYIIFSVNLLSGLIFLASLVIMYIAGRYMVRMNNRAEAAVADEISTLDSRVIDIIGNFVSVKAFQREVKELRNVIAQRKKVIDKSERQLLWNFILWTTMGSIVRVGLWPVMIVLNVSFYLNGQITLGQLTTLITALVMYTEFIWGLLWNLSQVNLQFARMEEAYRYLFGTVNVITQKTNNFKNNHQIAFKKHISIQRLQFAYPDQPGVEVLKSISIKVRKNEKIGIVGASGSGKSTLTKLLLGYYKLPRGTIAVDDQPIDNRQLADLITYVPQDTALFHRSIAENIAYGARETVDQIAIEKAAKQAHAHEFITQIPHKYNAVVGERGIKLSMGQRQRIAIARAFVNENPILVLDEATSALDSESELLVQKALEELWGDRTVIAIAHRLSTLRHMDRIIVMDKGEIIEQGSHDELLAKNGKYYQLWQHQSGGILVE